MKRIVSEKWVREIFETPNMKISTQRTIRNTKSGMKVVFSTRIRLKDVFRDLGHEYADFEFDGYIVESIKFADGTEWEIDTTPNYREDIEDTRISEISLINKDSNEKVCIMCETSSKLLTDRPHIRITSIELETGSTVSMMITCTAYSDNYISYIIDTLHPKSINYSNSTIRYLVFDKKVSFIPKKITESIECITIARKVPKICNKICNRDETNTVITSTINLHSDQANPVSIITKKTINNNNDNASLYKTESEYETMDFIVTQESYDEYGQVHTHSYKGIMYTKTLQYLGNVQLYKTYHETNFEGISDDNMRLCVRKYHQDGCGTVVHKVYKDNPANTKVIDLTYDSNGNMTRRFQTNYDGDTRFRIARTDIITSHEISPIISVEEVTMYLSLKDEDFKEKEVNKKARIIYTLPFKDFGQIYQVGFRKKK